MSRARRRTKHWNWKGGRTWHSGGYIAILKPNHPNADNRGYVREHIFVMSKKLGRSLSECESVHHKNGIRTDNRLENLELMSTNHPMGGRVKDKIKWAIDFLKIYSPSVLKEKKK